MRTALLVLAVILASFACGARSDLLVDSDGGYSPQPASTSTGASRAMGTAETTDTATDTDIHSVILPVDSGTASCMISASNYNQSCTVDSDCTEVTAGNFCNPICLCGGSTISAAALAQYNADVAATPQGSGIFMLGACPCPSTSSPCCRQGLCTTSCQSAADTVSPCQSVEGVCLVGPEPCGASALPYSCANPDEVCCPARGGSLPRSRVLNNQAAVAR